MSELNGKKIAFLLTDGYEDSELTSPWEAIESAGGHPVLIAPETGFVVGKNDHRQKVDLTTAHANPDDYHALVLPGGVVNSDHIRMDDHAVKFTRAIANAEKPIAVICHGGWILTDADVLKNRRMTSYSSMKTDLRNAGATWVDEQVVVDHWLISSRTPDDLPAFNEAMVKEFAKS